MQELRRLAALYGVERVRDKASKESVLQMARAIQDAPSLADEDSKALAQHWSEYKATFPDTWRPGWEPAWKDVEVEAGNEAGNEAPQEKEWRFRAGQLTYNSTAGEWASRDRSVLRGLFDRFLVFIKAALAPFNPAGTSATLEDSTHSLPHHVHIHVYAHFKKQFKRSSIDMFVFEGIRPHLEKNTASGNTFEGAVRRGHYYVVVPKIGTFFEWADYLPFRDYAVEGWWIDNWLKSGKLTRATYLQIAAQITVGFQRRLTDVRAAENYEKQSAVEAHVAAELDGLGALLPMKMFPEVERFLAYFRAGHYRRRPMLAIVGGTNLGKSLLAGYILKLVGGILSLPQYLEITVESHDFLDFSDYDHRVHSGVLLDGVGDALLLKKNRELLQGRPKIAKGGQSGTMIYSYPFTLCRRAVVATFDLAAANLEALSEDHWLANELNVIVLRLAEKAWIENSHSNPEGNMSDSEPLTPDNMRRPPAKRRMPPTPGAPELPTIPAMP